MRKIGNSAIQEEAIRRLAKGPFQTGALAEALGVEISTALQVLRRSPQVQFLGTRSSGSRGRPPMWWGVQGDVLPGAVKPSKRSTPRSETADPTSLQSLVDAYLLPALKGEGIQYMDREGQTWVFGARAGDLRIPKPVGAKSAGKAQRKRRVRLTKAQRREVRVLLKEGRKTQEEIAAQFGVAGSTISRVKRRRKNKSESRKVVRVNFTSKRKRKTRLLTEEVKAQIRALLKKGHKIDPVARKTGHSWRTVKALA